MKEYLPEPTSYVFVVAEHQIAQSEQPGDVRVMSLDFEKLQLTPNLTNLLFSLYTGTQKKVPEFPKVDRMMCVTSAFPLQRPSTHLCTAFELIDFFRTTDRDSFYIKAEGAIGNAVWRLDRTGENEWHMDHIFEERDSMNPVAIASFFHNYSPCKDEKRFLVEETIPIPRTSDGHTWEVRALVVDGHTSLTPEVLAMKKGNPALAVNTVARGGTWHVHDDMRDQLAGVFRSCMDGDQMHIRVAVETFLDEVCRLAWAVRDVTDVECLERARAHLPSIPEDARRDIFSSSSFCVDITGAWNNASRSMKPMIIEAQHEMKPAGSINDILLPIVRAITARKYEKLRQYVGGV